MWRALCLLVLTILPGAARAQEGTSCSTGTHGPVQCIRPAEFAVDTCQAIAAFAAHNAIDPHFFARLIWQESRFDPNALSPANARGIAQFIDGTAALRGLRDSNNPAEALEYAAEYLGDLIDRFGNPGLAAVAYNGGEARAAGLIAGTGGLARETIDYVRIITGLPAEVWRDAPPDAPDFRLQGDMAFLPACRDMAVNRSYTAFTPPPPDYAPWGVQLAYGRTMEEARAAFDRRATACRDTLADLPLDLIFTRNRVSGRAGFYMARVGAQTSRDANGLCNAIREQGCTCAVYRN
ncbi:Transglycosylase SLT domain-containing protein [Loktanella fryxellensis]|uniref:Transglycosylase SLT domain-containing protein n=1 Tax=Loktanella fryxellensis TaxID=245187 RepID=A0A1H8GII2_9RHOB|nr:lytic transglycosylase domain-containing protein [Loktanella fryxellensis]SEN43118.1 Transglycosylase SLT domain-containing protein [Loktanella fryxellensis]